MPRKSAQIIKSQKPIAECTCAFTYFAGMSREDGSYSSFPTWVSEVQHVATDEDLRDFDLLPITPGLIKKMLRKRLSGSAPGDDGITYRHLKMMPSAHHFLATLFSKILLHSQAPPSSWFHAKIITIHKKGDPLDPANFRPIALTSVIGKLFHKVLAIRLEDYLIHNSMIDKSLPKGFLQGVNGCIEHVFAVQSIIANAQEHSVLLSMSFIDLQNAFGSVSPKYIDDMLKFVKLPLEFANYFSNLYTSLSAHVSTKDWTTNAFPIQKVVCVSGGHIIPLPVSDCLQPYRSVNSGSSQQGFALRLS